MQKSVKYLIVFSSIILFSLFAFTTSPAKRVILIDAGHGGKDVGATVGGFNESSIVENIALKIRSLNTNENIEIKLIRDADDFIELADRVAIMNNAKPSLLLSLHINTSKDKTMNGITAYVSEQNSFYKESLEYAHKLVNCLADDQLKKGEVGTANFKMIKNANCPAVNLQVGFLSNDVDRDYLSSEKGQEQIAYAILKQL